MGVGLCPRLAKRHAYRTLKGLGRSPPDKRTADSASRSKERGQRSKEVSADAWTVRQPTAHGEFLTRNSSGKAIARPLLFVLIVGALLFGWLALRANPGVRQLTRAAKECAERYAEARSMRDTVRVDGTYPTEYAQEFSPRAGPATCGQLRRGGSLP